MVTRDLRAERFRSILSAVHMSVDIELDPVSETEAAEADIRSMSPGLGRTGEDMTVYGSK